MTIVRAAAEGAWNAALAQQAQPQPWPMSDAQGCAIVADVEEISGASYSHKVLTAKHCVESAVRLGYVVPAQQAQSLIEGCNVPEAHAPHLQHDRYEPDRWCPGVAQRARPELCGKRVLYDKTCIKPTAHDGDCTINTAPQHAQPLTGCWLHDTSGKIEQCEGTCFNKGACRAYNEGVRLAQQPRPEHRVCDRGDAHDPPCNGWPRIDCPAQPEIPTRAKETP